METTSSIPMNPHIETIRKACIAANPLIVLWNEQTYRKLAADTGEMVEDDIRLADVLLAIEEATTESSFFVDCQGGIHEWFSPKGRLDLRTVGRWNLHKDLEDQSEETLAFVARLLK